MLKNIQIVRRFGPVGGMERYVWELAHALADSGVEVHIVCEEICQATEHLNIVVHVLGNLTAKPRWVAALRFSYRVSQWVNLNTDNNFVIHSHERTSVHHITTFHSAVFANIRKKPCWKRISIRIAVWLYLEKRELSKQQVLVVLPNSDPIKKELNKAYPHLEHRLYNPAYPGTHILTSIPTTENNHEIIIFIGRAWKRKGLEKASVIVNELRKTKPKLQFWVFGPPTDEILHLFKDWKNGYNLFGWEDAAPHLSEANLLLHPASSEPYGMAIAEASAAGVPVVVSNQCGISPQITFHSGKVINTDAPISEWVNACLSELNRTTPVKTIGHSWKELAQQHIEIYSDITKKLSLKANA